MTPKTYPWIMPGTAALALAFAALYPAAFPPQPTALQKLEGTRFCAAVFAGRKDDCGWRVKELTYRCDEMAFPGLSSREAELVAWGVLERYRAACGLRFTPAKSIEAANVRWLTDAMPGPVVGRAEIGCAFEANRQARLWIDSTQAFDPLLAARVSLHEFGHVVGLAHREDDPSSIMYPSVTQVSGLSERDRADLRVLYGPTRGAPAWIAPWPKR